MIRFGQKLLFFLVFFGAAFTLRADKLEDGFERLQMFDYFRAKENFEKIFEKKMPGAAYGLSKIFLEEKNPFHNLDSARKYILICDSTFRLLENKEKKYYQKLAITDSAIKQLSDEICNVAYMIAEKADTLEAYDNYLNNYGTCMERSKVLALRNSAAFRNAEKLNTSSAYASYLKSYPESAEKERAEDLYEQHLYEESTLDKTISSYEKFILSHPESPYREEAERMIFKLSTTHQTVVEYATYARKYSSSRYSADAWRQVYALTMKDFSEANFTQFKNRYPDYPFVNEMESDYKLQNYTFLPIETKSKWGYINEEGTEMIAPQFDEATLFSEGLAVAMLNGKYGYINKYGKTVLPFIYADAERFKNGYAVVMKDSLYGLINRKGEFVIPAEYEELSEPSENISIGVKNGKSGYITKNGKGITTFVFDVANDFKDGFAIAAQEDKYGVINLLGKYVISPTYDELIMIGKDRLKAYNNGKWGVVDLHGDVIIPFMYDAIGDYGNGLALVALAGKYGYVNDSGMVKIPMKYLYTASVLNTGKFEKGYALLQLKNKTILADSTGNIFNFPGVENYGLPGEGYFPVMKNKKWGYADAAGKIKIATKFDEASAFENGYAIVKTKGLYGLIDTTGTFSILPLYDKLSFQNGSVIISREGKIGLMTTGANLILPCAYKSIDRIGTKVIRGQSEIRLVYVDNQGKIIHLGNEE